MSMGPFSQFPLSDESFRHLREHYWREYRVRITVKDEGFASGFLRFTMEFDLTGRWSNRRGDRWLCTDVNCTKSSLMQAHDKDFYLAEVIRSGFVSLNSYVQNETGKSIYEWAKLPPAGRHPQPWEVFDADIEEQVMRAKERKELLEQVAEMVMDRGLPKSGAELSALCEEIKKFAPKDKAPLPRAKADTIPDWVEVPF